MSTSAADFDRVTATVTSGATEAPGVTRLGGNEAEFLSQVVAWPAPPDCPTPQAEINLDRHRRRQ